METASPAAGSARSQVRPSTRWAQLLQRLDAQAVDARLSGTDPLPFFATMKELTMVGYYTSEIGAAQELQYVMMPGRHDGDVPVGGVGRAYSRCSAHT